MFYYKLDFTVLWPISFSLNLQELFNFGPIYAGSTKSIPFLLQNKGHSSTRVEFDFSEYKDFKLTAKDSSGICFCYIRIFIK